jgi:uncharacterized damage-inducible protein DinB
MLQYLRTLARYNAWANTRLYDAAVALGDAACRAPRPAAYFGSLLGTLNHVLVGDRVWLGRIEGVPSGIERLDRILHDDLPALRAAREACDRRIGEVLDRTTEADLAGLLRYRSITNPKDHEVPLGLVWGHVFNHQTHHRGQAHALIKDTGREPPALDLIYFLLEAG